ncbi:MAG: SprT-like domain-containing protein [Patescibacteria group bacterium]
MNLSAAETLAHRLLVKHDLTSWSFRFDRARRRFGCCNFTNRTISLSRILTELNPPQKILDTLLHEIAHALVGPRHAHDAFWRAKVSELGGTPTARFRESEVALPQSRFRAVCPSCGKSFPAFRRRKNVACRACCQKFNRGKFTPEFRLQFSEN